MPLLLALGLGLGMGMPAAWAETPKEIDAEIMKNLDFYQYLDVAETQQMYEVMEKNAEATERHPIKAPQREEESP